MVWDLRTWQGPRDKVLFNLEKTMADVKSRRNTRTVTAGGRRKNQKAPHGGTAGVRPETQQLNTLRERPEDIPFPSIQDCAGEKGPSST